MKKTLLLTLILFSLLCSCSDYQDQVEIVSNCSFASQNQVRDSVYVSSEEAIIAISKLRELVSPNDSVSTRSMSYSEITPVTKDNKTLAYIVNFPNQGGFIILSGIKKYNPILAYSEIGNYQFNYFQDNPSDYWLEAMVNKLSNQAELPNDSVYEQINIWNAILGNSKSSDNLPKSRYADDYDMNELQMIMQDSIISWSQHQDYELINLYEPLTGDETADIRYWNDTEQATYILYENEWKQLTIGLRRPNGLSRFVQFETINTDWHSSCNSTFKYKIDSIGVFKPFVGAGALAVGQIMNYYRYPDSIDWEAMDTPECTNNSYISDLLYKICEDSHATYRRHTTLCDPEKLVSATAGFGYDVTILDGLHMQSIPCVLFGKMYNRNGATPKWYEHYITVSGVMSLYFETRIAIYTFTGEKTFNECWHWIEYYSSQLHKINWHHGFINNGWYDLNVNMSLSGTDVESFKITKTINIEKP